MGRQGPGVRCRDIFLPGSGWSRASQVKAVGTNNPVVKAVMEIQEKYPGILPTRLRTQMLGGLYVDEAYIYKLPITVPG